ncbi:MAG: ferritin family protein [Bacteroidales bacterium]|nr:ferritin family protein [Bacteroidales bacterium]
MSTDYKKILEMAIGNEIEAHDFYMHAASRSKNELLKSIFTELAEEEEKHKRTLEGFLNNQSLKLNFHVTAPDYKIAETIELPKLTTEMSFADGVALAIKKEQEAMEMYQKFADASSDVEQQKIFLELATMELGHKVKLEDIYVDTAYKEVW